jgi:catechol 2,3-dioxygenase-like lactoylglutathione lyase family enzyme
MKFSDRYPIVVTPHKDASRDFWTQCLGFKVGFDSTWFAWLCSEDGSASIAFMTPDHPSAPPGPVPFSGAGICFELQVDDAAKAHDELVLAGLRVGYPLTDEPFGQRRFGFVDPSGLWVDVVEQIEPRADYWNRYLVVNQAPAANPE